MKRRGGWGASRRRATHRCNSCTSQSVDNRLFPGSAKPALISPGICTGITDDTRPMDILGLITAGRVRNENLAINQELIEIPNLSPYVLEHEPPLSFPLHSRAAPLAPRTKKTKFNLSAIGAHNRNRTPLPGTICVPNTMLYDTLSGRICSDAWSLNLRPLQFQNYLAEKASFPDL